MLNLIPALPIDAVLGEIADICPPAPKRSLSPRPAQERPRGFRLSFERMPGPKGARSFFVETAAHRRQGSRRPHGLNRLGSALARQLP